MSSVLSNNPPQGFSICHRLESVNALILTVDRGKPPRTSAGARFLELLKPRPKVHPDKSSISPRDWKRLIKVV